MASLCFVTTCMGRFAYLERTLGQVVRQHDSSCVVVDYSCPDRCGEWVKSNYPGVRLVRVPGEKTFNRSVAANAGSRAADAPWICFFDCDVLFEPSFAKKTLPLLQPGYYYCPDPMYDLGLCGTFICSRQDFERVGGFDEVYKGWGERDFDVYCALEYLGIKRGSFSSAMLRHLPHGDDSRVQFHDLKNRGLSRAINRIYRLVKFDMMYITETLLPQSIRERLYEEITQRTKDAMLKEKSLGLVIEITGTDLILKYEYSPYVNPISFYSLVKAFYSSHNLQFIKIPYRFIKASIQRFRIGYKQPQMGLDLTAAMYQKSLPFEGRLELTFSSKKLPHLSKDRPDRMDADLAR